MSEQITKKYLKNLQYGTTVNLDARIKIHQLFSTDPESFHSWIGGKLSFPRPVDVLDVGCGTGIFWSENLNRLPAGSTLTLTDFSDAMVKRSRESFSVPWIKAEVADVEDLPYESGRFDMVNAHHVIYHAEDKDRALNEIKRVARADGTVTITTNSERHMRIVYEIGRRIDARFPLDRIIDSFTEEIADTMLARYFDKIEKHVQEDLLRVTDITILLDYVATGVRPRNMPVADGFFEEYANIVSREIEEKGYFGVPKRSPLYICSI